MKFPSLPIQGGSVKGTVNEVIDYLRPRTANMPVIDPEREYEPHDTIPPLWPILSSPDNGSTFTFTLSDGFVVENTPGVTLWPVTGVSSGGHRSNTAITAGQQISVVVETDVDGVVAGATVVVETEDTPDILPDGGSVTGEFHYKIAVLRAAADSLHPAYFEKFLAGSHIAYNFPTSTTGLTGYVRYVKHDYSLTSTAKLYVRYENGRVTATQDDYTSGAVPGGWGALLFEVYYVEPAGYGGSTVAF